MMVGFVTSPVVVQSVVDQLSKLCRTWSTFDRKGAAGMAEVNEWNMQSFFAFLLFLLTPGITSLNDIYIVFKFSECKNRRFGFQKRESWELKRSWLL